MTNEKKRGKRCCTIVCSVFVLELILNCMETVVLEIENNYPLPSLSIAFSRFSMFGKEHFKQEVWENFQLFEGIVRM